MKKFLIVVAVLLLLAVAAVYLGGGWALERAARRVLPVAVREAGRAGVKLGRIDFESATLRPLATGIWRGWRVEFTPPARGKRERDPVRVRLGEIEVSPAGWSPLTVNVRARGVVLDSALQPDVPDDVPFAADEFGLPVEKVDEGFLELDGLDVGRAPETLASTLASDVLTFLREGRTTRVLKFGARLHFKLRDAPCSARLETERRDGFTVLRLNRADLETVASHYYRPLTEAEKRLVCDYPLRAPLLLRIKEYAERVSKRLAATDRAYGEDFTRHVLWSYWLARTYGAEFAQHVTDAHEAGATDNTAADHRQDFANNAAGRAYAAARKSEWQVLQLIKTDPQVVRVAR